MARKIHRKRQGEGRQQNFYGKHHYKNAIDTIGMIGSRQTSHNKLNQVMTHTDDPLLNKQVKQLM